MLARGARLIAAILGFIETVIWLLAMGLIVQNLTSPLNLIAFAGGFAVGNYVGVTLERLLSIGNVIIRIVTRRDAANLIACLRQKNFGVTVVDAEGAAGPVKIIFTVASRRDVREVVQDIRQFNPQAFYTIEDVQHVAGTNLKRVPFISSAISRMSLAFKFR